MHYGKAPVRLRTWLILLALAVGLGACKRDVATEPNPENVLEFEVCPEALATLPKRGGYQGYDGWFYYNYDLWETNPNLQEADFIVKVKEVLKTQGVELVLVPLPGVGLSNPEFLYPEDPAQAAFSAAKAQAAYEAFIETLRTGGVEVVDALAAMRAYSAAGGYTFFKRDIHWMPESANIIFGEVAKAVKQVAPALPPSNVKLTRVLPDTAYFGKHINDWLVDYCGYHLPPESFQHYEVEPSSAEDETAEVVQSGSSFSVPPFDVGFLSAWLQTPVYNASIANGGMVFALEAYLRGDVYTAHHPKVIVWEFPISVPPIVEPQRRKLIASVYGLCRGDDVEFQKTYRVQDTLAISGFASPNSSARYLSFTFGDLTMTSFNVTLNYRGQEPDTFSISHPRPDASVNSGRFFAMLKDTPAPLESLVIELPGSAEGDVTVQLCHTP